MNIHSYSKPLNIPHRFLDDLWDGVVYAQEKVDGSQISVGIIDGVLYGRSRKQELLMMDTNPSMFRSAVLAILAMQDKLKDGWIYRGEYLMKPKHNSLAYASVPENNIILYDLDRGNQDYVGPTQLAIEATSIGLQSVPLLAIYEGKPTLAELDDLLEIDSILGGVKIEGVVLKNYQHIDKRGKVLMGKHVSQAFKEHNSKDWKKRNPNNKDVTNRIIDEYGTDARIAKAVQHLSEQGELEGSMRDIPAIMKEVNRDILEECGEEIKEALFKLAWKKISRGIVRGVPEFYKAKLKEDY